MYEKWVIQPVPASGSHQRAMRSSSSYPSGGSPHDGPQIAHDGNVGSMNAPPVPSSLIWYRGPGMLPKRARSSVLTRNSILLGDANRRPSISAFRGPEYRSREDQEET